MLYEVITVWVVFGYSLAFGDGGAANGFWGGFGKALLDGIGVGTLKGSIPETVFAMFQLTFAIITPALVVGAYAERVRFSGMLLFSTLWLILVYCPVAHWVWGDGWLQKLRITSYNVCYTKLLRLPFCVRFDSARSMWLPSSAFMRAAVPS